MENPPSREELFVLMWDQPTTKVAKQLGVSNVAIGKLCRRMQVPKPPRGYWAKIQAGEIIRKPPLPALREQIDRQLGSSKRSSFIPLTTGQFELLKKAIEKLFELGIDTSEIQLAHDGVKKVSADFAAQLLILIQNQYRTWIKRSQMLPQQIQGFNQRVFEQKSNSSSK